MEEEEEEKDQDCFPQSKRGKNNIHSRVTVTTTHHLQHDNTATRTHNQREKKTSPKDVKNKGGKITAGTKRFCTKVQPKGINKTTNEKKNHSKTGAARGVEGFVDIFKKKKSE